MKIYELKKINEWGQEETHLINLDRVEEIVLKVIEPKEGLSYKEYSIKISFNNGAIIIHKNTPEEAIKLYNDIKKCMEE